MKTLILAAHGSRLNESNTEIEGVCGRLGELLGERGYAVTSAFLELARPGLEATIRAALERGCEEVVVLPYFLAAGRHVREDLPAIVERLAAQFPAARVTLLPHFGGHAGVPGLLAAMVE